MDTASEFARAGELLVKFLELGSSQFLTGIGSRSINCLANCRACAESYAHANAMML
jgi:hypothetical protein